MAGTDIQIDVMDHVSPLLRSAVRSLTDFKRPLSLAGHYMQRETIRQFETEGARGGTPWQPLAKSTIRQRRKRSNKILQDTGRLRQSMTAITGGDSIWQLSSDALRMGTNLEYANIHQQGGDINRISKPGQVKLRRLKSGAVRFAGKQHKKTWTVSYVGGKAFRIHIPKRPFLVVTDENRAEIGRIFLRYATGAFK